MPLVVSNWSTMLSLAVNEELFKLLHLTQLQGCNTSDILMRITVSRWKVSGGGEWICRPSIKVPSTTTFSWMSATSSGHYIVSCNEAAIRYLVLSVVVISRCMEWIPSLTLMILRATNLVVWATTTNVSKLARGSPAKSSVAGLELLRVTFLMTLVLHL